MSYGNGGYNRVGGQGQGNPYDQRRNEYDPNGYNSGGYTQGGAEQNNSRPDYTGYNQGDVEMQNVDTSYGGSNAILNDCRDIDRSIDEIDQQMQQLETLYRKAANDPDQFSEQINSLSARIMSGYRGLVERVRKIKSQPESKNPRNQGQVGRVDRKLKDTITKYQKVEQKYRQDIRAQAERQYQIINPDASPEEIRAAGENSDVPMFQQALMQSDRRGQAISVLNSVRARHEEIQRIEQQMIQLAELFQDLDTIVMEQGEVIMHIEKQAEDTSNNVVHANTELNHAIDSGRGARRKKWWCLLIGIVILVIIAIIVAVVVTVTKNATTPPA